MMQANLQWASTGPPKKSLTPFPMVEPSIILAASFLICCASHLTTAPHPQKSPGTRRPFFLQIYLALREIPFYLQITIRDAHLYLSCSDSLRWEAPRT